MSTERNQKPKAGLHPRNRNRKRYDLEAMAVSCPELVAFIQPNKLGKNSVDFADPEAVKALNRAILIHYYGITYWDFPEGNLCPPIPGRAEYLHYVADLLAEANKDEIPTGSSVTCLDVGVGASCIYPVIGVAEYGWRFIGSDIDAKSIASAQNIADSNPTLKGKISLRLQDEPKLILKGIVESDDKIDVVICNPPFHATIEDAMKGSRRKVKNLTGQKTKSPKLNHSGNHSELVYEGGELQFISNLIAESRDVRRQCRWFTTLVSKESNLRRIYRALRDQKPTDIKTMDITTGNKVSRIVAWTYKPYPKTSLLNISQ